MRLVPPQSEQDWGHARRLIEEYAGSLAIDLSFQDFAHELEHLAGEYAPPTGAFLFAEEDGTRLGCVCLRRFADGVGEIKRLYVTPVGRGRGVGRLLAEGIVGEARRLGYARLLLDTLPSMREAQSLYVSLGFRPIAAYRFNPVAGAVFLGLDLKADAMTQNSSLAWWRGARGEWYVAAQLVLMAVVFLGPRKLPGAPAWPSPLGTIATAVGAAIALSGVGLLFWALLRLGSGLTPLPHPRRDAVLVQTGPYRLVRHPMYAGGIALAFGWALIVHGSLTLVYAAALWAFLEIKSTREERWLVEKFPGYPDYQRRVRKLIPFVH